MTIDEAREGAVCRMCDPPERLAFGALHSHLRDRHPARYRALSVAGRLADGQLQADLDRAIRLLEAALHLRMNGERAPGGSETWQDWDRRAETFLRGLLPAAPSADSATM